MDELLKHSAILTLEQDFEKEFNLKVSESAKNLKFFLSYCQVRLLLDVSEKLENIDDLEEIKKTVKKLIKP